MSLIHTTGRRTSLLAERALGQSQFTRTFAAGVNGVHTPHALPSPLKGFVPKDNSVDLQAVTRKHWDSEAWPAEESKAALNAHAMLTWSPGAVIKGLPLMVRGEGVYLYDSDGKQYVDLTAQAVCANLGHTAPPSVKAAINHQLDTLPFVYSGLATCEPRARLAKLLSEVLPGDINGFLFPTGGGEANEAAIRMARRYTGRHKIISHYRSYHGGTTNALAATGDFRRWFGEQGAHGFVKAFGPSPWHFSQGRTEEEEADRALAMLEEQILLEGPGHIAAIMMESIVGAGGAYKHPAHYVQGVRALCDRHGILLIMDEVMMGFGRTGKMWGFQHYEGVLPDMVTAAKGLTASILPLSMLAVREPIKKFFEDQSTGWGATFHAHPMGMACALATVKHVLDTDVVGQVNKMAPVLESEIARLVEEHPSVARGRSFGLFSCLDMVDPSNTEAGATGDNQDGTPVQRLEGPPAPGAVSFKAALHKHGVFGLLRLPLLHITPPLNVTEAELLDATQRLSSALNDSLDKQ